MQETEAIRGRRGICRYAGNDLHGNPGERLTDWHGI
jgi:hypothetical protein